MSRVPVDLPGRRRAERRRVADLGGRPAGGQGRVGRPGVAVHGRALAGPRRRPLQAGEGPLHPVGLKGQDGAEPPVAVGPAQPPGARGGQLPGRGRVAGQGDRAVADGQDLGLEGRGARRRAVQGAGPDLAGVEPAAAEEEHQAQHDHDDHGAAQQPPWPRPPSAGPGSHRMIIHGSRRPCPPTRPGGRTRPGCRGSCPGPGRSRRRR